MSRFRIRNLLKLLLLLVCIYFLVDYLHSIKFNQLPRAKGSIQQSHVSPELTHEPILPETIVLSKTVDQDHTKEETISIDDTNSDVRDWHNYTQIAEELKREGPGEQGTGVRIPKAEEDEQQKIYRENGYDGYASDKISLQRSLKDIRHPDCKKRKYLKSLPNVSIIIPFHQEHWSPLLRTVDSVIRRSPKGLIHEVLLVDDASRKPFLMKPLEVYLKEHYPVARVIRTDGRQGLIRTRLSGAREATGDVLIFLDSHTEANVNWLPPLLDPIARNYKTVTCPFIDVINMDTFEYVAQDEGARGAFDWRFDYKRVPRLKSDAMHPSDPFESPVMAGGLFAISRKWFWELGGYDEGLDIWGGEQYEISFKIWQCGGSMLDIPCSRIGHVYRKFAPFPNNAKGNFVLRNFKRVAVVWMDEYIQYLYLRKPELKAEDPLNLTKQFAIRERLHCKNFSWFMHEVAFDLTKYYPLIDPTPVCSGEIRLLSSNDKEPLCIDFKFKDTGYAVGLSPCLSVNHEEGGDQNLIYSWQLEIRAKDRSMCLDVSDHHPGGSILLFPCHGGKGNQFFRFHLKNKQIIVGHSGYCLNGNIKSKKITVEECDTKSYDQKWLWTHVNETEVQRLYTMPMENNQE